MSNKERRAKIIDAVLTFSGEMIKKLLRKEAAGWSGWDDRSNVKWKKACVERLKDHVKKAEIEDTPEAWADVANFAMFSANLCRDPEPGSSVFALSKLFKIKKRPCGA